MGSFDAVVLWNGGSGGLVHQEEQRGSRGHVPKKVMWNKHHKQCYFQTMKCPSSHALHVYRDGLQRSVSFHGGILKMRGCLLYIHRSFEKRCFGSSCIVPICKNHWCRCHPKDLAGFQLRWGWGMHRALELDFETEVWERWAWWKLLVWWILKITDPLTAQSRMIIVGFTHKHSKASLPCSHCG